MTLARLSLAILLLIGSHGCSSKRADSRPMLHVFVVRHAEAYKNIKPAPADMTPAQLDSLTVRGTEQAKAAGVALRGRDIVAVIASPANRAQQTAQIMAKELGVEEVTTDEAFGPLAEGTSAKGMSMGMSGDRSASTAAGESLAEGVARARMAIDTLAREYGGGSAIVIVSHGDIVPGLIGEAARTPMEDRVRVHELAPGASSEIVVTRVGWEIGKNKPPAKPKG